MKLLFRLLIALAVLAPLDAAKAQNCTCSRLLPLEGLYDLGNGIKLELSYIDGTDDTCPSQLRAELRPQPLGGAAITAAYLDCEGDGRFFGLDDASFQGSRSEWSLAVIEQPFGETTPDPAGFAYGQGISTSRTIEVTIRPPGSIRLLPGARSHDRTAFGQLTGAGTAPPCICSQIDSFISAHKQLISLYGDVNLQAKALNGGSTARPTFSCYGTTLDASYSAEGKGWGRLQPACMSKGQAPSYDTFVTRNMGNGQGSGSGSGAGSAAASIDPSTCELQIGKIYQCDPQIWLQAVIAHETRHQQQCRRINASKELRAPARKLRRSLSKHPAYSGQSLDFLTASFLYFNNPKNRGPFEVEAYNTSLSVLQSYKAAYCR